MTDLSIAALRRAKEILGSEGAIARVVGMSQPYVHTVLTKGSKIPAEWCIPLERATADKVRERGHGSPITRHDLRPDIYPREDQGPMRATG